MLPVIHREGRFINPIAHLRTFYNDTTVSGSTAALICGYDFFSSGLEEGVKMTQPFPPNIRQSLRKENYLVGRKYS
jgi:hypothetical protein